MASVKKMRNVIINTLNKNQIYSSVDIADIIDNANILRINDYNLPKSGCGSRTIGEISLSYLLTEMVRNNILSKPNRNEYKLL